MAVLTRADWSAGPHRAGIIRTPVSRLFLHHTVTPFWVSTQAARNLQAIARSRGFLDISYSWLTDRQGNEIEGRGWGRDGAHTSGFNSTAHAISLVGNLEARPMPAGMIRGAVRLVRRHRPYGPDRITHGHRDVASTACPGYHAYARVAEINRAASGTPSLPFQEENDMFSDTDRNMLKRVYQAFRMDTASDWSGNLPGRVDALYSDRSVRDLEPHVQTQVNMLVQVAIREALAPGGEAADAVRQLINEVLDDRGQS